MATATKARVPREILYDRYQGLEIDDSDGGDWTELQQRLSSALTDFSTGTARCHADDVGPVIDELYDLIREHIVRRVDETGLATGLPPEAPNPNRNGPNVVDDGSIVRDGVGGWNR
jgi:hypothetical protein